MGLIVRVLVNDGKSRRPVEVEVVKRNKKTLLVRLPNGKIIKRKLSDVRA